MFPGGSGRGSEDGAESPPRALGMSFSGFRMRAGGLGGNGPALSISESTGVGSMRDLTTVTPVRLGGLGNGGIALAPRAITVGSSGLRTIVTFGPGTSGVRGRGCRSTCSSGLSGSGPGLGSFCGEETQSLSRLSTPGLGNLGRGASIAADSPGSLAMVREPLAGDLICRA